MEHEVVPGVVESLKIITEKGLHAHRPFAFEYARKNQRKKIHAIHKANIMKLSDGFSCAAAATWPRGIPRSLTASTSWTTPACSW
jgi:isocitrate dehydrogenase (NAD+)